MLKAVTAEIQVEAGLEQAQEWLMRNRAAAAAGGLTLRTGVPLRAQRALSSRVTLQSEQGTLVGLLTAVASPYPGRPLTVSFSGRVSGEISQAAGRALALGLLGTLSEPVQLAA